MKARVMVTLNCNRKCDGCCNKGPVFNLHQVAENLDEILKADEIMITGGEPMLLPIKVFEFIKMLRYHRQYKGKIYLYSAYYPSTDREKEHFWYCADLCDGVHFTLHAEATDRDVADLKRLSEDLGEWDKKHRSFRLAIDKRLYEKFDFSNIDFTFWDVVRKLVWMTDCPLPKDEKLFLYDLTSL
jgi:organic radical activating enzyme